MVWVDFDDDWDVSILNSRFCRCICSSIVCPSVRFRGWRGS